MFQLYNLIFKKIIAENTYNKKKEKGSLDKTTVYRFIVVHSSALGQFESYFKFKTPWTPSPIIFPSCCRRAAPFAS
jgi:hypothetical protein